MDDTFDRMFYSEGELIGGVDESGVSDIAGPLVAACVILPKIDRHKDDLRIFEANDCKKIPKRYRRRIAEIVWQQAKAIGIGEVSAEEHDLLGHYNAASLARLRSVLACKTIGDSKPIRPDFLIIDGQRVMPLQIRQALIIDGDEKSLCVAASSVIAKVYRDEVMDQLHSRFPVYGWNVNHGFPCKEQLRGLDEYGIALGIHRVRSWPFVAGHRIPEQPEDVFLKNEAARQARSRRWKDVTLRRMVQEVGGDKLWTTKPPLLKLSPDFKTLPGILPSSGESTRISRSGFAKRPTPTSSPTCTK